MMTFTTRVPSVLMLTGSVLDSPADGLPAAGGPAAGCAAWPGLQLLHQPGDDPALNTTVEQHQLLPLLAAHALAYNSRRPQPLPRAELARCVTHVFSHWLGRPAGVAASHCLLQGGLSTFPESRQPSCRLTPVMLQVFRRWVMVCLPRGRRQKVTDVDRHLQALRRQVLQAPIPWPGFYESPFAPAGQPLRGQTQDLLQALMRARSIPALIEAWRRLGDAAPPRVKDLLQTPARQPNGDNPAATCLGGIWNGLPCLIILAPPRMHGPVQRLLERRTDWRRQRVRLDPIGQYGPCQHLALRPTYPGHSVEQPAGHPDHPAGAL